MAAFTIQVLQRTLSLTPYSPLFREVYNQVTIAKHWNLTCVFILTSKIKIIRW